MTAIYIHLGNNNIKVIQQISMNASTIHATPMQRVLTIMDRTLVYAMSATVAMDLTVQVSVISKRSVLSNNRLKPIRGRIVRILTVV